jgi:hypothetical protein
MNFPRLSAPILAVLVLVTLAGCDNDGADKQDGAKKRPTDPLAAIAPTVWIMKVHISGRQIGAYATSNMPIRPLNEKKNISGMIIR